MPRYLKLQPTDRCNVIGSYASSFCNLLIIPSLSQILGISHQNYHSHILLDWASLSFWLLNWLNRSMVLYHYWIAKPYFISPTRTFPHLVFIYPTSQIKSKGLLACTLVALALNKNCRLQFCNGIAILTCHAPVHISI